MRAACDSANSLLRIFYSRHSRCPQIKTPFVFARPTRKLQTSALPFHIFNEVPALRTFRRDLLKHDRTVGLVPTMGALHAGHLSLIRTAAEENTDVFVSIFVNPTQFGVNEDLASYPRTWDTDISQLAELGQELATQNQHNSNNPVGRISALFHPSVKTMYPTLPPSSEENGDGSFVLITPLGRKLEGNSRPVFFRGVATVCTKLFNIVQPDRVYFGQKDIQQSVLIQRMVQDFHIPTQVRVIPTSREKDGLALSSRNVYLGERRRSQAPILIKALRAAQTAYQSGETSRKAILGAAEEVIAREDEEVIAREDEVVAIGQGVGKKSPAEAIAPFEFDYISLADPHSMDEITCDVDPARGAILSGAVKMLPVPEPRNEEDRAQKPVRLIDNIILPPK